MLFSEIPKRSLLTLNGKTVYVVDSFVELYGAHISPEDADKVGGFVEELSIRTYALNDSTMHYIPIVKADEDGHLRFAHYDISDCDRDFPDELTPWAEATEQVMEHEFEREYARDVATAKRHLEECYKSFPKSGEIDIELPLGELLSPASAYDGVNIPDWFRGKKKLFIGKVDNNHIKGTVFHCSSVTKKMLAAIECYANAAFKRGRECGEAAAKRREEEKNNPDQFVEELDLW